MSSYTYIVGPLVKTDTIQGNAGALAVKRLSRSVAGAADVTLTGTENEASVMEFTGALTGNINVIVALAADSARAIPYLVFNNTTGAFTLTVKGSSGSGVAVTQGKKVLLVATSTGIYAWSSEV